MRLVTAGLAALVALWSAAARANDAQGWATVLVQGPVRGDLALWLEVQGRLTDDVSRLGRVIFRPAIGVRVAPGATAMAGYAYIYTDPERGRAQFEHRPWQQLIFPVKTLGGRTQLLARLRMEERFLEGQSGVSARLRTLLRLQPPKVATLGPLVWAEGFWNFNDARWGPRAGFEQLRVFGGVSIPVAPQTGLEAGYLRQVLYRPAGDQTVDIASVTLNVRLGR